MVQTFSVYYATIESAAIAERKFSIIIVMQYLSLYKSTRFFWVVVYAVNLPKFHLLGHGGKLSPQPSNFLPTKLPYESKIFNRHRPLFV